MHIEGQVFICSNVFYYNTNMRLMRVVVPCNNSSYICIERIPVSWRLMKVMGTSTVLLLCKYILKFSLSYWRLQHPELESAASDVWSLSGNSAHWQTCTVVQATTEHIIEILHVSKPCVTRNPVPVWKNHTVGWLLHFTNPDNQSFATCFAFRLHVGES